LTAVVEGREALIDPTEPEGHIVPEPRNCPFTGRGRPAAGTPDPGPEPVDPAEAHEFLAMFHAENPTDRPLEQRLAQVDEELTTTGTYRHTREELAFGAQVAWRNSARCIGRLYWRTLQVRDRRHLTAPDDVAAECTRHLRDATRGGRIRSTITVFAPDVPERPGPRIHNEQLIRYAGHRAPDGTVRGDPRYADFTDLVAELGWQRPEPRGRFDVLPLLVSGPEGRPQLFDVPDDAVLEVPLTHPEYAWFADLRLRWHAVPAISNMPLVVGGVRYPAAPFNGWYLNTEIGARNLADTDRYDLLPVVAERMGLDTSSMRTLWRDRALVELVRAVQHSFDTAGVTMADHHSESERFLTHLAKEEKAGRSCPADWTWIVPPMSGGLTPVFHRYYDDPRPDERPAFLPPLEDPRPRRTA
jgi:nitric-oxide synthase